jgi:flavorubredoxin
MTDVLMRQLEGIENIDFIISHHAEQDHSGAIPNVLQKYPNAKVIANPKGKGMLVSHLNIAPENIVTVNDGEVLSLGDKTLQFIYTPWVHWPETMSTYLAEDRILFTCDFFGSHLATSDLYVTDEWLVGLAAKRYYAEIMMPFRTVIQKDLEKIKQYDFSMIAPSHGPVYDKPAFIIKNYVDWVYGNPHNLVVLPYVSMHGSTYKMVQYLVDNLVELGVGVEQFDLSVVDLGKLAIALVDAGSLVVGTPTVMGGPHPSAAYAAVLANILRPKLKFISVIGSYGWRGKAVEPLAEMIPSLKVEVLSPVLSEGLPSETEYHALRNLATTIADKHKENMFE